MSATYRLVGASLGQLEPVWIIHLQACCREFGVVGWQPTGLMGLVDRVWGCRLFWDRVWGCMLATYRACRSEFKAVGWQPTGLISQPTVLVGHPCLGCVLASYRSYGPIGTYRNHYRLAAGSLGL